VGVGVRLKRGWARTEDHGGIEAAATGSDGLLLDAPNERWYVRSTRHLGRAVVLPVLPSFLFGVCCSQLLLSDELFLVGWMDSFYTGRLLSSLLCH